MVHRSRGIFYFPGRIRCPLAGVGARGDHDSNRLALDDGDTEVTIDRDAHRITVRNERHYPDKTVVCDLLFLAEARTASGARKPLGIHLKIQKHKRAFMQDLHRHLRTQDPLVAADLEPFEVVVSDGASREVVFDEARAQRLVGRPSLALRVVKAFMAMRDHLDGVAQDPARPGFRVVDLSVGFGALGLDYMMARARLESTSDGNADLIERGSIIEMLRDGAWKLEITALSEKWLPEVVRRDLFLFGLDEVPLLRDVRVRGLRKGETLSFRFDRGSGEVGLGSKTAPLPSAIDVARAYLEFHMLGGLIAERAERGSRAAPR